MFEDISPWPSPPGFFAGESAHGASRRMSTLPPGLVEFSPLLSPSSAPLPHSLATLTGHPTNCAFPASSFSPEIGAGPSCTQGNLAARQRLQEIKELDLLQREEKIQRQLTLLQEEQRQREAAQERGGFLGEETVLLGRNNNAQSGGAADLEKKQKQGAAGVCPPRGGTEAGPSNTSISGCGGESQRKKTGDDIRGVSLGRARDDHTHAVGEVENIQHCSDDKNRFPSRHFPSLLDSLNDDPLPLSYLCGNSSLFLSPSSLLSLGFLGSSGGSPTDACTPNPCLASAPRALSSPQGPESTLSFSPSPPKSTRSPTLLQCEWATAPQPLSPSLRGLTGKPNQVEGSCGPAARRSFSCRDGIAARGRRDSNGLQRSSSVAPGASSPGAAIFEFSARAIEERETPQSAGRQALSYVPPSPQARDICPPHKHLAQQLKLRERKQQERLQRLQRQQLREEERKKPVKERGQSQKTGEAIPPPRAGRVLSGGGRARMLATSPGASGTASRTSAAATMPTERKATPGAVTGVLLSLSAHPSAKTSVPSLTERASDKQRTPGVSCSTREARHDSRSRRVTARLVAPKAGTTHHRGLQEDLPRSKATSSNARQQASFAVGEQIAMVPPRTAGVKNAASATLRRKGAEDKERQGGISGHLVSHTLHPDTRSEDRSVSPFVGTDGGTSAFGSASLADGAGSAREGDCSMTKRKSREAKPSVPAHSASPIRFSAAYAKSCITPTRRKNTGRKIEAKTESGTALVVCAKGLQRAKGTPVREKGRIEANPFGERRKNESGRIIQLTNVSPDGEDDCEIRLRQILQKLRARLLERKAPNDDDNHPSGEVKSGRKRVPVTGDTDGRRTTEEESRGGRDDALRYEEAAGQERYSLDRNSPTFGAIRAKSGVRKEERRLSPSSGHSERVATHREPIYVEKEATERETAGACRRQSDKKVCQATGKVHTRSSTDSRERELSETDSSGDSDSSGWSVVEHLRRILRGEGKKRRHAESGVSSTPCRRGRGQEARKREFSLSSSGNSVRASGGSWRRRRRRSGRREATRLLKKALWHKDEISSPANAERHKRSCRSRWRSPSSSPSSHTSSTSPRQSISSLLSSSLPSSVSSTVSPRSRASPLSASFASSISSSGSSPSLITKWLHYSAALLQSQGSLTDSGVTWMPPPEQTSSRPATGSQRRTRGERYLELSKPDRGKETSNRAHKQGDRRTKRGEERRRGRGSHSSSSRRLHVAEGSVYKANVMTDSGEDRRAGEKRSYNPLTEDPEEVVRRIKKRLGLPVSPRRDSSHPSSVHSSPSYASCSPGGNRQMKRNGGTERVAMARAGRLQVRLAEEREKGHSLDTDSLFPSTGRAGVIRDPREQRRGKRDMLLSGDKGVSLRVHSSPNIHSFETGEGSTGRNDGSRTPRGWQPLSSLSLSLSSSSVTGSPSTQADTGPGAKRECGREVAFPVSDRLEQDKMTRDRLRLPSSGSLHLSLSASPPREESTRGKTRKSTDEKERPQATRAEIVSFIQSEGRAAPQKTEESPPPSESRAAHERVSLYEEAKKDSKRDADQLNLRPNSSQLISFCVSDEESAGKEDRGETQIPTGPRSPAGRGSQKLPAEKGQMYRVRERASKEGNKLPSDHLASRSSVSGCDDPDGPLRISALLNSLSQSFGEAAAAGTVSSTPAPKETNFGESSRSRRLSPSDAAQHSEGLQARSQERDKQEKTNSMARTRRKENSPKMISESFRLKTNDLQRECINRHDTIPPPGGEVSEASASRERGEGTLGEGVGDKPHLRTETPLSVSFAPFLREEKELSKEQVCLENVPDAVEREKGLAARASKTHDVSLLPQARCPSAPGAESEETHQEGDLGSTLSAQLADIQQLQSLLAEADALERSHASLLLRGDNGGACDGSGPRAEGGKGVKETDLHEPREEEAEPRNRGAARNALNQVTMQKCPEGRQGSPVEARGEDSSCADGPLPAESRQDGNSDSGSFSEKAAESTSLIQEAKGDEAGGQRGESELGEQEREQESTSDESRLDRQAIPQNVTLAQVEEARSFRVDENQRKEEKLLPEAESCLKAGDAFARMGAPGSSEGRSRRDQIALHERPVQQREGSEEKHKEGAGVLESQGPGSTLSDVSHSGTLRRGVAPRDRGTPADGCEGEERQQQTEKQVVLPEGDSIAPANGQVGSFLNEAVHEEQHLPLAATEMVTSCVTGRQNLPGDRESAVIEQIAESYSHLSNATSLVETDPTKPKNPAVAAGAACKSVEANSTGASGTSFQAVQRVQMSQSEIEKREQPREQDEAKETSGKEARERNDCDAGRHRGEAHRAAPPHSSLLPMLTNLLQKQQPLLKTLLDHLQQNQDTSNSTDSKAMPAAAGHTADVQKFRGDSSGRIQKCTQAKPSNAHEQTLILQDRGVPHTLSLRKNTRALQLAYPSLFVMQSPPSGVCIHLGGAAGEASLREHAYCEEERNCQSGVAEKDRSLVSALTHQRVQEVADGRARDNPAVKSAYAKKQETQSFHVKNGNGSHLTTVTALEEPRNKTLGKGRKDVVEKEEPQNIRESREIHCVSLDRELDEGQSFGKELASDENTKSEQSDTEGEEAPMQMTELEHLLQCIGALQSLVSSGVLKKNGRARKPEFSECDESRHRETDDHDCYTPLPRFIFDFEGGGREQNIHVFGGGKSLEKQGVGKMPRPAQGVLRAREASSPPTVERRKWESEDLFSDREDNRLEAFLEARRVNLDRDLGFNLLFSGMAHDTDVEERELMEILRLVKRSGKGRNTNSWNHNFGYEQCSQDRWYSWGGEETYREQRRRLHEFVQRELHGEED
ncbi:hypothetical protein TGRUB_284645 [Toxoplasma gondii RUB]|uniref:Uncharacterized protein n=2 Tax=Toxoplasma gondii TaxID=5811 RepID=A0A086M3B2_TOXGO|nr:hypothetical protein TGRUB_284645 [Toxoplasma gondii RUB]KFH08236.1 hypothetical protein TGVAND_284645 [Toxoplasma gondii VAND]